MTNHLYIIGNGFDKHHDIHSGYQDYRKWLEYNERWAILETIDNLFGYTSNDWWSHFEENLASVEALRIAMENTCENYPDFGSDDFKDRDWYTAELSVEQYIKDGLIAIKNSFREWVEALPKGNSNKMIKIKKEQGIFLSFNYTETLESLYKIPANRILHIHGNAFCEEELVVGHGKSFEDIEKLMGERIEEGDYVFQRAKDAAVSEVLAIRKPVEEIIKKYEIWFHSLSAITNIHIYGHSLSEIDLPYLKKIFSSVNIGNILIEVNAYTENDKLRIKGFMESERIPSSQFQIIDLHNLQYVKELCLDLPIYQK